MRILLTTLQYLGHIVPAAVFKHTLEQRGHYVHWEICAVPPISGPLEKHLSQYAKETANQNKQLRAVIDRDNFDCLVSDPPIFAAWDIHRDTGMPWAIFGNLPIFYTDSRVPLYLQCSLPDFEPSVRVPNVKFIGPMVPDQIVPKGEKPFWARARSKKVHATEGTVAKNGLVQTVQQLALHADWIRIPDYFDYCHWMGEIDCFVTNGGFSAVSQALFYGVPMVLAGTTEDKTQVSERIDAMGCGINLKTDTPSPGTLRNAIEKCLSDEKMKETCRKMAKKCQFFSPYHGVDHLERLVFDRFDDFRQANA